jgi:hypothetical protein
MIFVITSSHTIYTVNANLDQIQLDAFTERVTSTLHWHIPEFRIVTTVAIRYP